jgi:hypothetical protein
MMQYFAVILRLKNLTPMKRLAFYLTLLLLVPVFFACDGEKKKETENNTQGASENTQAVENKIPENGDFISVNLGGVERVFTIKPQIGAVNHTEEFGSADNNMLIMVRQLKADDPEEKFTIQLFNFPLRGIKAPVTFRADEAKKRIDIRYVYRTQSGQLDLYKSLDNFEFTIEKIEGDVFEGTFSGPMSYSTETLKAEGKFRITMIDPINQKQPA